MGFAVVKESAGEPDRSPSLGSSQIQGERHDLASYNTSLESSVRMKIDLAVVPLAALLFLWCFIDRTNVGNARLAGLEDDLGLHGYDFNSVNTMFYVSYTLFEVPSNILCKMIGPGWYIPVLTICFGIISICTGYVNNYSQLAACRFLLGIFEAGIMPGLSYYLSRFYRHSELTFRLSLYIAMAPLSGAFGGLLASAILKLDGFGAHIPAGSWRAIFVLEGVVTVFVGFLCLALMTDRPETARFLTEEEKEVAVNRLKKERGGATVVLDKVSRSKLLRGAINPATAASGVAFLFCSLSIQGLSLFIPTLSSVTHQQLLTVPPYAVGACCLIIFGLASWKLNTRQPFIAFCAIPMMIGYMIFLCSSHTTARYIGTFFMASTSFILGPLCHSQSSANVNSDTARSMSIAITMLFGNIGSLVSTWTFLPDDAPRYRIGCGLNFTTSSLIFIVSVLAWGWMLRDNRRRDAKGDDDAGTDTEGAGLGVDAVGELEWKHRAFRWRI